MKTRSVQQLEKALVDAKAQENLKYRQKELGDLIRDCKGKSFGSHTFDRSSAAVLMGATHYENFFIREGEIFVLEWNVSLSRYDAHDKKSKKAINFSRNIHERKITGNEYNASYNLYSGYDFTRKEISHTKFLELWESGSEAHEIIKKTFNGKAPELKTEYITQGDYGAEQSIEDCIKSMHLDIIDFKKFPKVHSVLEYKTLPMFDKRRWLPKIYAKQILQWEIGRMEKDLESPFTTARRYEAVRHEIAVIEKFVNDNL